MKKALIMAGYESSGIGNLMRTQSFVPLRSIIIKTPARVKCPRSFVSVRNMQKPSRGEKQENLFFYGTTGLGKTHLSTSIAKAVIDRGYDVVYDTAQNVFSDFEYERFSRGYNESSPESRTDRYFQCDLLILDDLGAEMTNQFTVSCLYNLFEYTPESLQSCHHQYKIITHTESENAMQTEFYRVYWGNIGKCRLSARISEW